MLQAMLQAMLHTLFEGGGGNGAYSLIACLGHLTISHAFLSRRSTAFLLLLIVEVPPTFGRSLWEGAGKYLVLLWDTFCSGCRVTALQPAFASVYLLSVLVYRRSATRPRSVAANHRQPAQSYTYVPGYSGFYLNS